MQRIKHSLICMLGVLLVACAGSASQAGKERKVTLPISGGKTAEFTVMEGGLPAAASAGGYTVQSILPAYINEEGQDKLFWILFIRCSCGEATIPRITVSDVTNDVAVTVLDAELVKPAGGIVANGEKYLASDAVFSWLYKSGPSHRIFRISIFPEGREPVELLQLDWYSTVRKNSLLSNFTGGG